ncbi:MCE family protein [bacterium]|nr:MCE family protein [bacterium]
MSQARNKRRNNIRAGVFVTLSLILGLVVFSILTNAWSRLTTSVESYTVTFPVSDGIGTLSSGSKVRLGGVLVGKVDSVTPRIEKGVPISNIDVVFQLDQQYTLYTNASIQSRAGLLGSTGWLAISDVGNGEEATQSTQLQGSTETMVSQLLGRDAEVNISKSLDALRKISEALSNEGGALTMLLGKEESDALKIAIDSAESGLKAMDSILNSTDTVWPDWESSITTILSDSEDIPSQLQSTLESSQEAIQDVRKNVLPNVEDAMQSLKNTMQSLESMSKAYEQNSPVWVSKITDIVQNIDQITERAKKAIDEISASPWRLVSRPTDREIAYEQLNAASWQLLSSLSDLRESIEMLQQESALQNAPVDTKKIEEALRNSEREFENARIEILDRMKLDFPNR